MVFEDHFTAFREAFEKVTDLLQRQKATYSVEAIRQKHPKAYEPWSTREDERLRSHYQEGFDVPELARVFQRGESAIRSRLEKLGIYSRGGKR
jgi:hypothetical protein